MVLYGPANADKDLPPFRLTGSAEASVLGERFFKKHSQHFLALLTATLRGKQQMKLFPEWLRAASCPQIPAAR